MLASKLKSRDAPSTHPDSCGTRKRQLSGRRKAERERGASARGALQRIEVGSFILNRRAVFPRTEEPHDRRQELGRLEN
jgi:hypothetical protein